MANSRVVLNRSKVDALSLAIADGLFEVGKTVVETARPPDAPPLGVGLVQQGGVIAYVRGKKVADSGIGGRAIKKPRAASVRDGDVVVVVGWGFPARFVEFGTIHNTPDPFFTPARDAVMPSAVAIAAPIIRDIVDRQR